MRPAHLQSDTNNDDFAPAHKNTKSLINLKSLCLKNKLNSIGFSYFSYNQMYKEFGADYKKFFV